MKPNRLYFAGLLTLLFLSSCRGLGQTPPPPPYSVESLGTSLALTENAPPPGFEKVSFPGVEQGLQALPGYHYLLDLRFNGAFVDDGQLVSGHIQAEVWWDSVAPARRVVLQAEGEAFAAANQQLEGVRIGENYYLVDNSERCLTNVEDAARGVADLDAGSMIGGVVEGIYSGTQAVLNNIQAYRYDVTAQSARLPMIRLEEDSEISLTGELWVSPEYNVVIRYYANLDVSNIRLSDAGRPVSGQLFIRFDLSDVGQVPNISIPYGC